MMVSILQSLDQCVNKEQIRSYTLMETSNCTEPNEKPNKDMPPTVRDIIDQAKFVNLHPESKAFRDRLFESQIFANFIEHEHRIKYLMDQNCKTDQE